MDYDEMSLSEEHIAAESFINKILSAQQSAEMTHRYQRDMKLSTHLALESFYKDIDDLIDDLTETYMGYYGVRLKTASASEVIEYPLQYFKELCDFIDMRREFCPSSFIQNQIDEIQKLIAKTLYRLTFIND